jgi:hypothetical protein
MRRSNSGIRSVDERKGRTSFMQEDVSRHRTVTTVAGFVLGVAGFAGSTLVMSGPAAAEPPVPPDVWIQCSGFSGQNTSWPHPLTGCISRQGEGSGFTTRTAPGTETVQWNAPFLNGDSFQLTNISSQVVGTGTGCPVDHPVEVNVSGTISATSPGTKQYDGSPVTATICSNQTDFILKPGTLFVIHKK